MRSRAEATVLILSATGDPVPWHSEASLEDSWDTEDAAHIAAMSPAVALAVADWLDSVHADLATYNATTAQAKHAFAVARAYLGADA